jgi:CYTH domain-containing protein
MLESEMSFLVKEAPPLDGLEPVEIEQFYLSDTLTPLRLRRYNQDRFELTKKIPVSRDDLSRQEEINIPLEAEEFEGLKKLAKRGLQKQRYFLPLADGLRAELDVYEGPLNGLVSVEVEFPDEASRQRFQAPGWFGRDITQDEWATNSFLAGKSLEEIRPYLEEK